MDRETFEQLKAEGYNRIPVYRSVLADLDTPLSVYLKLADGPDAYLFESVEGGETWGRFSIIGLPCTRRYELAGTRLTIYEDGEKVQKFTGNSNSNNARVILLDKNGTVAFFYDEGFSVAAMNSLKSTLKHLNASQ